MIYGQEIASQGFWSVKVKDDRTSSMNTTAQVHRSLFALCFDIEKRSHSALREKKTRKTKASRWTSNQKESVWACICVCYAAAHPKLG